jgi:hypothetical protein
MYVGLNIYTNRILIPIPRLTTHIHKETRHENTDIQNIVLQHHDTEGYYSQTHILEGTHTTSPNNTPHTTQTNITTSL